MNALHRITRVMTRILTYVACAYLVYIVFACGMQVFSRYILNSSFAWTEETARFAFATMGMLGAPVALHKGMHVNVDILETRLKGRALLVQRLVLNVLLFLAALILFRYGLVLFNNIRGSYSPAVKIPMQAIYFSVPLSGLASMWVLAVDFLDTVLVKWPKEGI